MIANYSPKALISFEASLKLAQSLDELLVKIVNGIRNIVPSEQVYAFSLSQDLVLEAVSDVVDFDKNSKITQDIEKLATRFFKLNVNEFQLSQVKDHIDFSNKTSFHDFFFGLKVTSKTSTKSYYFLFNRGIPFKDEEKSIIKSFESIISYYVGYFYKEGKLRKFLNGLSSTQKYTGIITAAAVIAFFVFFKVPLQSFADAEVIPTTRIALNAPTNGKISSVLVQNNEKVYKGEKLFEFDNFENIASYENAKSRLRSLEFELSRAQKLAAIDSEIKGTISRIQDEISYQENELRFQENLIERTTVEAPIEGIVIIEDIQKLIGTPFSIGQLVGEIIDANSQRLLIKKSVSDGINLEIGSEIKFFLDSDPFKSYQARIVDFSYKPVSGIDGDLFFDVIAEISADKVLPVGARGNARIYSNEVSLFTYWFRTPMVYLRHYSCGIFTC